MLFKIKIICSLVVVLLAIGFAQSQEKESVAKISEKISDVKVVPPSVIDSSDSDLTGSKNVRQATTPVSTTKRTTRRTTRQTTTARSGLLSSLLGGNRTGSSGGGFISKLIERLRSIFQFFLNLARNIFTRVRGLVGGSGSSRSSSGGISSLPGSSGSSDSLF